ncbi:MAG: hypothetical protein GXP54_03175, partial [Deltaproteobacteria bacterium]|nr:hypothetical protein [Deltaproteobacteria bacterium]
MKPDESVVAEVNGIPIPAGRFRKALDDAGAGADPREILKGLLAEEVLAQDAVAADPAYGRVPSEAYSRILVSRMIEDRFEDRFQPKDIPLEDLEKLFRIPVVRGRYNHLEIYVVQDYQWICCNGTPRDCGSVQSEACFAEGKAAIDAVYQTLKDLDPDSEDIPLILDDLRQSAPRLSYQEYEFSFDPKTGKQKGRRIFDDNVVAAVISVSPGHFAGKVKSAFGWHIPFLKTKLPAVHKDLSDPKVREEVAVFFHSRFQQRRFLDALAELIPVMKFRFLAPMYKNHEPKKPPAY